MVVTDNHKSLMIGSEALVQCFVPETMIESALAKTEQLLQEQGMRRIDVLSCASFEGDQSELSAPEVVQRYAALARKSGKALFGTIIISGSSASLKEDLRSTKLQ